MTSHLSIKKNGIVSSCLQEHFVMRGPKLIPCQSHASLKHRQTSWKVTSESQRLFFSARQSAASNSAKVETYSEVFYPKNIPKAETDQETARESSGNPILRPIATQMGDPAGFPCRNKTLVTSLANPWPLLK